MSFQGLRFPLCLLTCALLTIACDPEALSVGDVRCTDDACDHEVTPLSGAGEVSLIAAGLEPGSPAPRWSWTLDLDCGDAADCAPRSFVRRADGSFIVHAERHLSDGRHGPVLFLVDADGQRAQRVAEMDTRTFQPQAVLSSSASTPLLARGVIPVAGGATRLEVFRVGDDATPELLFEDQGLLPDGLIEQEGDVLVVGTADLDEDSPIEVRRYDRDGALVYRQAALRQDSTERGREVEAPQPLLPDIAPAPDGGAYVLVQGRGRGPAGLVLLDRSGAVVWHVETWLTESVRLDLSPDGAPLLIGMLDERFEEEAVGLAGTDGYVLMRLASEGPAALERMAVRLRSEFYPASPEAWAVHPDGDIYVATLGGVLAERTSIVDRLAPSLERTEFFPLMPAHPEDLVDVNGALITRDGTSFLGDVHDMQIADDGAVFVLMSDLQAGLGALGGGLSGRRAVLGKLDPRD